MPEPPSSTGAPVLVLPDPNSWDPTQEPLPTPAMQELASRAAAALGAVAVFGAPVARAASLRRAHARVLALHDAIVADGPLTAGQDVAPLNPIQIYFRLRRAAMTRRDAAAHATRTLMLATADLHLAPMSGSDLERSCVAMQQVIHDLFMLGQVPGRGGTAADPTPDQAGASASENAGALDVEAMWSMRWVVGHQLHALFNVMAAVAVDRAVAEFRGGLPQSAVGNLKRATVYVEGFPAARAQSLAVPAEFYNLVLRPSMLPPLVPAPLSGRMHIEYQRYQAGIDTLLKTCPEPVEALAAHHLTLALAREALLEADLIDAQRHVSLVEPLVGAAKSLIQHSRTKDNAISTLRRIHDRRAARFAPFLRFSAHQQGPTS